MAPSQKDLRVLYQKSGNRCAFPDCTEELTYDETALDDYVNLSNVAHIVARELKGPRGNYPLPVEERDKYENLITPLQETPRYHR